MCQIRTIKLEQLVCGEEKNISNYILINKHLMLSPFFLFFSVGRIGRNKKKNNINCVENFNVNMYWMKSPPNILRGRHSFEKRG